jgi:hypothetical protein|nr:MAG TPA_asm: hypothetical protein [Caudoviricetes sp.]
MDKIDFKNGSQPAINDTNLNLMQKNIEKEFGYKSGVVLYENENGTQNDITLSQSVADFDCIEIIFKRDTGYFSGRYRNANGKTVVATSSFFDTNSFYMYSSQLAINEDKIEYKKHGLCYVSNNATSAGNDDNVKIVQVLGYK